MIAEHELELLRSQGPESSKFLALDVLMVFSDRGPIRDVPRGICSSVQLSICLVCIVMSESVIQIARVVWKELRLTEVSTWKSNSTPKRQAYFLCVLAMVVEYSVVV